MFFEDMSIEEAIRVLKYRHNYNEQPDLDAAVNIIINRNTPKTIVENDIWNGTALEVTCPTCGMSVSFEDRYCKNCGQKLKLSWEQIERYHTICSKSQFEKQKCKKSECNREDELSDDLFSILEENI